MKLELRCPTGAAQNLHGKAQQDTIPLPRKPLLAKQSSSPCLPKGRFKAHRPWNGRNGASKKPLGQHSHHTQALQQVWREPSGPPKGRPSSSPLPAVAKSTDQVCGHPKKQASPSIGTIQPRHQGKDQHGATNSKPQQVTKLIVLEQRR